MCHYSLPICPECGETEVSKTEQGGSHVTCQLCSSLHVDCWREVANMDLGDDQEVKNYVNQEFDCRYDQGHVRFSESSSASRDSCFDGSRQSRECRYADIGQRRCSHLDRHKTAGELSCRTDKRDRHDQSEYALDNDQSEGKTVSCRDGSVRSVSNDQPRSPGETFIQDFGNHADIGVDISSHNHRGVDVGDPKFAECSIECRQNEGTKIEAQGPRIALFESAWLSLPVLGASLPTLFGSKVCVEYR